MNPMPKYAILSTVNGNHFGRYKLVGVRYSETVGEHIYTAIPVDAHGNAVSVEVSVVESCLAALLPQGQNTMNTQSQQTEPLFTVAQAVQVLRQRRPDMPELSMATLQQLGKDCTLCANVWQRPTGKVAVVGKRWPSEKSYTFDVIREAFSRNPATKAYVPQEVQS